jgi:hypothetical protein
MTAGTQEIGSKIERIEPGVQSPAHVQHTYGVESNLVTTPSIVAIIKLTHVPTATFAGSVLIARIQTGSRRFISFIPGVGRLLEG